MKDILLTDSSCFFLFSLDSVCSMAVCRHESGRCCSSLSFLTNLFLSFYLFSFSFYIDRIIIQIKLLIENKLIICALGNLHYRISREKFEPEPGFEPQTSGFLAWRSTTSAILVLMPAHVNFPRHKL